MIHFLGGFGGAELLPDGVEDSINEDGRLVAAPPFSDFEGLVDDDGRGQGFRFFHHLKNGQAEDIAVDRRHPGDAPMAGCALDERIQLVAPGDHSAEKPFGVNTEIPGGRGVFVP